MKLHRLTLRNYRGITDRTVEFPDRGVVVVHGANEIGKSSLVEALDLLLEEKDTSTKAAVRAVAPVNADLGSSVEAELTVGRHRLIYRKQFNRGHETVLTITRPSVQHLSGAAAHEKVQALLAAAVDLDLWKALRLLQSDGAQPVLARSAGLAAALDRAAGSGGGEPAAGQSLMDSVDREYSVYWTPTGRPTGSLRTTQERLRRAEAEAARTANDLAALDEEIAAHDRAARALEAQRIRAADAATKLAGLTARTELAESLRNELRDTGAALEAATAALTDAESRLRDRSRLRDELEQRTRAVEALREETAGLQAARQEGEERLAQAATQAERTATDRESNRRELELARADAEYLRDLEDCRDLGVRIQAVALADEELAAAEAVIRANSVDDGLLRRFESAAVELQKARARQEAGSAHVRLTVLGRGVFVDDQIYVGDQNYVGGKIVVDDDTVSNDTVSNDAVDDRPVGSTSEFVVDQQLSIRVTDQLELEIRPGDDAAVLAEAVRRRQSELDELVELSGRPNLDSARAAHVARLRAMDAATAADRRRRETLRDSTLDDLEARCAALRAATSIYADERALVGNPPAQTPAVARERLAAAFAAEKAAQSAATRAAEELAAAQRSSADFRVRQTTLERSLAGATSLLTDVTERHRRADTELPTDVLAAAVLTAQSAERSRRAAHDDCRSRWKAAQLDSLPAELAAADSDVVKQDRVAHEAELAVENARARLLLIGELGRQDADDAARTELLAAQREQHGIMTRAHAARLLLETLRAHQLAMKRSYVDPFRDQLVRLGRLVFGEDFEVTVDPELRVVSRTLEGVCVPFHQLSTGAQEQLGLLMRLACAALVDPDDGVPVFFDDALGHSDPDRLAAMSTALASVTTGCQLILLTGNPERYRGLTGARYLPLGAVDLPVTSAPFGRPVASVTSSGAASSAAASSIVASSTEPLAADYPPGQRAKSGPTSTEQQPARRGRPSRPAPDGGLFDLPGDATAINS